MMPAESGIIDANVLVYAFDADAAHHASSRALLEAGRRSAVTLYVTSQILCEFYSIVTNARRVSKPRLPSDALAAIMHLLTFVQVLPSPASAVDNLLDLLRRRPVVGADVFDLQLIAAMQANGVSESIRIMATTSTHFQNWLS